MRLRTWIALFLLVVLSENCKKHSPSVPATPAPSGPTIFVTGYGSVFGGLTGAGYWKNGVSFALTGAMNTTSLTVSDTDVYVAGNISFQVTGGGYSSQAVYWKNGTMTKLGSAPSYANSILVEGNNVYVVGNATVNSKYSAVYWKNGTLVPLSSERISNANSIAVSGSDVYVAGFVENFSDTAVYWKNGVLVPLEYSYSHANAIAISGTDIYVAGYVEVGSSASVQAVYWKNGVRANLNPPGIDTLITDTYASGIALSGTDVHIIGWQDNTQAIYWKNGVMTYLNNAGTYENMTNNMNSIAVLDTNVYISLNTADYWKNGKIINVGSGYATSIFVQPK